MTMAKPKMFCIDCQYCMVHNGIHYCGHSSNGELNIVTKEYDIEFTAVNPCGNYRKEECGEVNAVFFTPKHETDKPKRSYNKKGVKSND